MSSFIEIILFLLSSIVVCKSLGNSEITDFSNVESKFSILSIFSSISSSKCVLFSFDCFGCFGLGLSSESLFSKDIVILFPMCSLFCVLLS